MSVLLKLAGVTKSFGSLRANDDISLSLARGEVLALLGENGAGKTTLMNILFGHYLADTGHIEVDGQRLAPGSPQAAIAAGIGMVHQHFALAENLSVFDNITLGTESLWSLRRAKRVGRRRLQSLASDIVFNIVPDALVGALSVGERQRVEILKALYRNVRILILDEPTAVLTPQEVDTLFATLRCLADNGLSIIFISHKLNEILNISDRVAVLRRGRVVGEVPTAEAERDQLAEMMVGRLVQRPQSRPLAPGEPVVALKNVSLSYSHGQAPLRDINLVVRRHEIVGIAGVAGNGQKLLADLLAGLVTPMTGEVILFGQPCPALSPRRLVDLGVGRIPEDRQADGVIGAMSVWENLAIEDLGTAAVSWRGIVLKQRSCRDRANRLIEKFDIRCTGPDAETKLLSGGNIQKMILARALSRMPGFILANQPVRGLDEGAIVYVQGRLLAAREQGCGVLLISEDLDELFGIADRIAVMYQGRLTDAVKSDSLSVRDVGLMMSGQAAPSLRETA